MWKNEHGGVTSPNGSEYNGQRRRVQDGVTHECHYCGAVLESFATHCPACGRELRDMKVSGSISELDRRIREAYSQKQKIEIIRNFPVPNSREDVLEFMIHACSIFDAEYYVAHMDEEDESDAWHSKIEQCYHKAEMLFNENDKEFRRVEKMYREMLSKIHDAKQDFIRNQYNQNAELTKSSEAMMELMDRLQELDDKRRNVSVLSSIGYRLQGKKVDPIDEQKADLIRNFPIPNTMEDTLEFMTVASIKMKDRGDGSESAKAIANAWKVKYTEAQKKYNLIAARNPVSVQYKNYPQANNIPKENLLKPQSGWSTWSGFGKFCWVILNIYLIGIPAIIYACCKK